MSGKKFGSQNFVEVPRFFGSRLDPTCMQWSSMVFKYTPPAGKDGQTARAYRSAIKTNNFPARIFLSTKCFDDIKVSQHYSDLRHVKM